MNDLEELKTMVVQTMDRAIFCQRMIGTLPVPTSILEREMFKTLTGLTAVYSLLYYMLESPDSTEAECWQQYTSDVRNYLQH